MRALTEHEAKVVKEFTMEPTKPGGGRVGKGHQVYCAVSRLCRRQGVHP